MERRGEELIYVREQAELEFCSTTRLFWWKHQAFWTFVEVFFQDDMSSGLQPYSEWISLITWVWPLVAWMSFSISLARSMFSGVILSRRSSVTHSSQVLFQPDQERINITWPKLVWSSYFTNILQLQSGGKKLNLISWPHLLKLKILEM